MYPCRQAQHTMEQYPLSTEQKFSTRATSKHIRKKNQWLVLSARRRTHVNVISWSQGLSWLQVRKLIPHVLNCGTAQVTLSKTKD